MHASVFFDGPICFVAQHLNSSLAGNTLRASQQFGDICSSIRPNRSCWEERKCCPYLLTGPDKGCQSYRARRWMQIYRG
jgi:hypothetical protein